MMMFRLSLTEILKWCACASFFIIVQSGYSISRVGNGSSLQNDKANFKVDIPYEFNQFNFFGENSVRLIGTPITKNMSLMFSSSSFSLLDPLFIELRDFAEEYPELSLLEKVEVNNLLIKNNFRQLDTGVGKCIEVYAAKTQSLYTMIVWIDIGKGYVLIGPIKNQVKLALHKIINSTQVLNERCQWK